MDQTNQHNLLSLSRSHFLRKAIPILFTLSLLSLLFSLSSYFSFSFSSYLPLLLSTFSIKVLLSYSTDRKYIFVLCNGILAILITKSGLIGGKPPLVIQAKENSIHAFRRSELELSNRKDAKEVEEKEELELSNRKDANEVEEKEEEERKENGILVIVNKEDEDQQIVKKLDDAEEEDQEETEEEEEEEKEEVGGIEFLISLEELNKKCDNFIKLMREGIIQKLVMV